MLSFLLHPPTPELYTLSLHDALPICAALAQDPQAAAGNDAQHVFAIDGIELIAAAAQEREVVLQEPGEEGALRSEEHTSELQSHHDLVCRLLLEKKNLASNRASQRHQ